MIKENIPIISDEFLDEVTKEINKVYGFENNPIEKADREFHAEEE
ncbi:bacitracin ABC transporter ATP-binding protein [Metabacillus hrfriensis]|uniref:Bacitracin ABC transporter ATP-binding protein n=1 Tax=Metabacillus hrfriensis TaxID=3048891 RepID=A0ACD4RES4_9BACI|nr:bacitracin ABC transporter ATP-binding protein [Metabacillus sp. CT-WN-B3]WHZ59008.1 bacitracin ABC transporter ATP-binding protein [Metabacillus sp. CT-WN-B3]